MPEEGLFPKMESICVACAYMDTVVVHWIGDGCGCWWQTGGGL